MPRDAPASLKAVQAAFAAALDQPHVDSGCAQLFASTGGAPHAARFAVYRNNTRVFFATALERTYPVLRRRVGDEAFAQLAAAYRAAHPSRRGDLHHVGAEFPAWLRQRFADTEYAWLADLARLEWACELAQIAEARPPLALTVLADVPPEQLDGLRLELQPSLQLVESPYPVWTVWQANQGDAAGPAVDLGAGAEHCVVACLDDRPVAYRLTARQFAVVGALRDQRSLGETLTATATDAALLQEVLGWLFAEQLVVAVT